MKRFLSLLATLILTGALAHAQSTMPAMGTNTPKGEVAKTDASINQTSAADRTNTNGKKKSTSSKRVHKTKTTTTSTGAM
ncbi:MAG: hypothetical protein EOO56_10335 [Hymenobacter sp.]|nr:MAG: hypothetical protein EOO56_10335 [Hymenobacter sp.]